MLREQLVELSSLRWGHRDDAVLNRFDKGRTGAQLTKLILVWLLDVRVAGANVKPGVHILRHTFCSHLAMRGAPARAIQELAGHQDLTTTQRYMHLSPASLDAAIRLLDRPLVGGRGDIVEAPGKEE
jgi:site-specific recombinase XerD